MVKETRKIKNAVYPFHRFREMAENRKGITAEEFTVTAVRGITLKREAAKPKRFQNFPVGKGFHLDDGSLYILRWNRDKSRLVPLRITKSRG